MANRIDASVERMEASGCHGAIDGTRADTQIQELAPSHDSMLSLGEACNGAVPSVNPFFTPHTGVKYGITKSLPAPDLPAPPEVPA
ncbi:MAG: hypothetical protein QOE75_460 [Solirubrobacterales bacterium]|nr:hypothetical protein [Solirubrobacterales bacterium]